MLTQNISTDNPFRVLVGVKRPALCGPVDNHSGVCKISLSTCWYHENAISIRVPMLAILFCRKCQSETERYSNGHCKPCSKATNSAYYLSEKTRLTVRFSEYYAANSDKCKDRVKAYSASNPEKVRAARVAYFSADPERKRLKNQNRRAKSRLNGGQLSKGLVKKLTGLQQGKCACCNDPLGTAFHMDHILPIALGGPNIDSNIQLLCPTCNLRKGSKHPVEFA